MFTIRPQRRSRMCGHTACAQLNAPVRLTRRSRSQSSGDCSWNWAAWSSVPALFTRMSTEPSATRPERSISIVTRQEYFFGDHEALDLRGALVDLEELRVAHQLLDRVLLRVAVAAEHLHRVRRHLHRRVGGEALCERRVECR